MKNRMFSMPTPRHEAIAKTLWEEYYKSVVEAYVTPVRKGKRRGEIIGYSKKKVAAVVLCATTNWKRKDIAIYIGTSRQVLEQWCCQKGFKVRVRKHAKLFLDLVNDLLNKTPNRKFTKIVSCCEECDFCHWEYKRRVLTRYVCIKLDGKQVEPLLFDVNCPLEVVN